MLTNKFSTQDPLYQTGFLHRSGACLKEKEKVGIKYLSKDTADFGVPVCVGLK
jgi:hypothetical protein